MLAFKPLMFHDQMEISLGGSEEAYLAVPYYAGLKSGPSTLSNNGGAKRFVPAC